MSQGSTNTVK